MSEDDIELNNDIKAFQASLKHQINSFRKRIIEPGSVQYLSKNVDIDQLANYSEKQSKERVYDLLSNFSLSLTTSKVFRFIQLRSFAIILESALNACERKNPIEICFHLRNYLEFAASFSYSQDQIIPILNELIPNIKVEFNHYDTGLSFYSPTDDYLSSNFSLVKLFLYLNAQTNVDTKKDFYSNTSIVPDKNHPLKSVSIMKKLQVFEKKIDQFHPTYDLLSEYLHPNSRPFWDNVVGQVDKGKNKGLLVFKETPLNELMGTIDYFFGDINRAFLEEITFEILRQDSEFLKLQGKLSKKMRGSLKKLLTRYNYKSDSDYSKTLCVCGSKRKLIECCAN